MVSVQSPMDDSEFFEDFNEWDGEIVMPGGNEDHGLPTTVNPLSLILSYDAQLSRLTSISDTLKKFRDPNSESQNSSLGTSNVHTLFDEQLMTIYKSSQNRISKLQELVVADQNVIVEDEPDQEDNKEVCSSCSHSYYSDEMAFCLSCQKDVCGQENQKSETNTQGRLCAECAEMIAECYDGVCGTCRGVCCKRKECLQALKQCDGCASSSFCSNCAKDLRVCDVCRHLFCMECLSTFEGKTTPNSFICCDCYDGDDDFNDDEFGDEEEDCYDGDEEF
jgi:hypothetical protein